MTKFWQEKQKILLPDKFLADRVKNLVNDQFLAEKAKFWSHDKNFTEKAKIKKPHGQGLHVFVGLPINGSPQNFMPKEKEIDKVRGNFQAF